MMDISRPQARFTHRIPAGMDPVDALALHLFALAQRCRLDLQAADACLAALSRDLWPGVDVSGVFAEAHSLAILWAEQNRLPGPIMPPEDRPAPPVSLAPVIWIGRADATLAHLDELIAAPSR